MDHPHRLLLLVFAWTLVCSGSLARAQCEPSPEVCDGCDNDCDGVADDDVAPILCGYASPANCTGTMSCRPPVSVPGLGQCTAGGGWNACNNAPEPEACDGVDNDCDGTPDDSALGTGAPCGVSQPPCSSGVTTCVGGELVCLGGNQPTAEVCDLADNDCDGLIDEAGPSPMGVDGSADPDATGAVVGASCTPSGAGACSATFACMGGNVVCVDEAGSCPDAGTPDDGGVDDGGMEDAAIDDAGPEDAAIHVDAGDLDASSQDGASDDAAVADATPDPTTSTPAGGSGCGVSRPRDASGAWVVVVLGLVLAARRRALS